MQDKDKTKDQLIEELNEMRHRVAELEAVEERFVGAEQALSESDENTHLNLSNLISPDHPTEEEGFADVLNIPQIQSLMDDFYKLTNIGIAILDLKGNILLATGWQDICTKFHRVHPDTLRNCIESDLHLTEKVNEGEYLVYKCKNNMWDMVTPIVMGGKRVGNLYLGQFLFEDEVPDIEVFKAQAQRYGFNEDEYLVALNKVPRWSREQVNTAMTFYSKFASIFGELSYSNLNLTKMVIKSKTVGDALRESQKRFRNVFEQGPIGIAIIGLDYRWITVNAKVSEIVGYTKDELTKLTFVDITHPDDIDKDVEYAEQLSRGEIPYYSMEKRFIKKNGEVVWINLTATMIHDDHHKERYYLSMIEDITESKRMENKLQQSEQRYRSLVEYSFDGIFIQKGFKITFANSRLYEMLGYSPGELEGMDYWLIYHPDYQDLIRRRAIARMRGEEVISQYEVMLQKQDGSSFPAEIRARLVQVDGEPGIQIWLRDISERRRSEVAQRRLAIAVEQSIDAILITDRKGNIEYANKVTEQIADCGQAELIGKKAWTLDIRNEDETYRPRTWGDALKGEIATGAILLNRENKEPVHLALTITPVRDASGQINSVPTLIQITFLTY
ncbi:MAG: PAS domain S-box protein [Desulfomonilaceae bacterium]